MFRFQFALLHSALPLLAGVLLVGCTQPSQQPSAHSDSSANGEASQDAESLHAICQVEPIGDSGVAGTVHFDAEGERVLIHGMITGLSPGKHGLHVHENGDLSNKETGESAGGHFNPTGQPHGRPSDAERHIGDLGNIEANENGTAEFSFSDDVVQLEGPHSIVGRALVVHAQEDEFTQPSGNAGDRVAFGLIERTDESAIPEK